MERSWDPARELSPGGMPVEIFLKEQQRAREESERGAAVMREEERDRLVRKKRRGLLIHRR